MFSFYLAASDTAMTIGEKLSLGGKVSLLGMGMVFAVLAILWGLVELLHLLLGGFSDKKKEMAAPVEVPVPAPTAAAPKTADDLEIIAVITAAVAAASGSSPNSFRVVSFKRANNRFSSGK